MSTQSGRVQWLSCWRPHSLKLVPRSSISSSAWQDLIPAFLLFFLHLLKIRIKLCLKHSPRLSMKSKRIDASRMNLIWLCPLTLIFFTKLCQYLIILNLIFKLNLHSSTILLNMQSLTNILPFIEKDGIIIVCNLSVTLTELKPLSVQPISSFYDVVTETPNGFSH